MGENPTQPLLNDRVRQIIPMKHLFLNLLIIVLKQGRKKLKLHIAALRFVIMTMVVVLQIF